ncbi:hypothetical protein V3C99_014245 [Haemonchus contortus]
MHIAMHRVYLYAWLSSHLVKMHPQIISAICAVLLFARGYTEEYECSKNVPPDVQKTLIKVINNKCSQTDDKPLSQDSYQCELGKKAFAGRPSEEHGSSQYFFFDGSSPFNFDWEDSLTAAVNNADKEITELQFPPVSAICHLSAKKIGCFINLSTSNDTGIHELKLLCNYGW